MVIALTGAGGKTGKIHELAVKYREEGKRVLVTTTTHMWMESDAVITDDPQVIRERLEQDGYCMAGGSVIGQPPQQKMCSLRADVWEAVWMLADVVLVEADGSRQKPLKCPNEKEPVIPSHVDQIQILAGLSAIGKRCADAVHRFELAEQKYGLTADHCLTAADVQKLIREGYWYPLKKQYPKADIRIEPRYSYLQSLEYREGKLKDAVPSMQERVTAELLRENVDVTAVDEKWFQGRQRLFILGGGHIGKILAEFAPQLDFETIVMDDREEYASRELFPAADQIICDSFANLSHHLTNEANTYYVIVTRGHESDQCCVETLISRPAAYIGMIGSRRKVRASLDDLEKKGYSAEQISLIHAPIGLSIGSITPAEIAVSILAEIISVKRKENSGSMQEALNHVREAGTLCIITDKKGSSPRGIGSMMFVQKETGVTIGSVGGGRIEYEIIQAAPGITSICKKEFTLTNEEAKGLGMACGGWNEVLFIPVL